MPSTDRFLRLAVAAGVFLAAGCSNDAKSTAAGSYVGGSATTASASADAGAAATAKARPATADSGFRASTDGFSFANYADPPGPGVFDSTGLRRMFGDAVCSSIANGTCNLTPQGQDWVDKVNLSLEGGHCEGFAVLSLLLFNKWVDPTTLGGTATSDLSLVDNGALNHELAYWYATQFLEDPVITTTHAYRAVDATNYLLDEFSNPTADTVSRIGIARIDATGAIAGGHAITPYAVVAGDTSTTKKIMVYDSNHPGEERAIDVDLSANSWSYTAGTTPDEPDSLYEGDPTNKNDLYVATVHPRLGVHPCPFCSGSSTASSSSAPVLGSVENAAPSNRALLVHGNLEPLVKDASGNRVGRVNGVIVNEIPGAKITPGFSGGLWADNAPTQITLPPTGDVTVSVTPRGAPSNDDTRGSVALFGGGYSLGINYAAGATVAGDTIGMPSDAKGVTFTSVGPSSATLAMSVQTASGGIIAKIAVAALPAGANVGLNTDAASGTVGVKVASPTPVDLQMNVGIDKGDGAGKQVFEGGVTSTGADSVGVSLANWTGGTDPMPITVAPSDGSAPTTVVVTNAHDYTPPAVDECTLNLDNCSINATCTDTPASFTCTCNDGFGGDGVTCVKGATNVVTPPAAPAIAYVFVGAPAVVYTVGKRAVLQPPANTGGKIATYSIAPALPGGLVFDPQTGAISGTPAAATAAADYAVTATNAGGSATATLNITVQGPAPQIAYSPSVASLFRWDPAPSLAPTSTGGPVLEYAIAPALPAGLALDPATGVISGTPTMLSPPTSYTVTASNTSGSWPFTLTLGVVCVTGNSCDLPPGFVVGGTVTGSLSGLVLQNNGGDNLTITADGSFVFPTSVSPNAPYAVTVLSQPTSPPQTCTVTRGAGTVTAANVSNVAVACVTNTYAVGGTITGLAGAAVLQNNGGNDLVVGAAGAFAFTTPIPSGSAYAVSVRTQPSAPAQTCTVASGSGSVGAADVTSVAITCETLSFTIGARISGLANDGLVLQNNGGEAIAVTAESTSATFPTPLPSGRSYAVTIQTQPAGQTCSVSGGTGVVGGGNVSTVVVSCGLNTYTVGGTISGLAGTVVLQNNAGDNLTLNSNGTFAFATPVRSDASYAVTVATQPGSPAQTCVVSGATGTVSAANITSVGVVCSTQSFTVGGTVTGLNGSVTLENNGGDDLTIGANGSFTFATPLPSGTPFGVTVSTQPTYPAYAQTCTVAAGSGSVGSASVTGVTVTCTTNTYTIGGTYDVGGTATIQNAGGNDLVLSGSGSFAFSIPVASGGSYSVAVSSAPTNETCVVNAGSGTVSSANVTSVSVSCVGPSSSCKSLLAGDPTLPDGVYTLPSDGDDASYQAYCDMTTDGGGWTLVMKLAAGDFCNDSANWTTASPWNESNMLDPSFPGVGNYDAKSRAFYQVDDGTSLRFDTTNGSVTTTFVSSATAQTLMTTNTVAFAAYPDRTNWRNAFGQDRNKAPIFMRAGVPVTDGNTCRTNPQDTPVGCGKTCMFCYQASDGDGCGVADDNDTSSGMGNGSAYCGGGLSNCSAGGQWSNPNEQALVWVR